MEGKKSQFLHPFHHGLSRFVPAHIHLSLRLDCRVCIKLEPGQKTNRIRYRQSTMHATSLLPQAVVDFALLELAAVVAMAVLPRTTGAHISEPHPGSHSPTVHRNIVIVVLLPESPSHPRCCQKNPCGWRRCRSSCYRKRRPRRPYRTTMQRTGRDHHGSPHPLAR